MENTSAQLGDGIFFVGGDKQNAELRCNPYLLVEGGEGILIDPGSSLDFAEVRENVESILPLDKIRYIILHHQDPDLCGSVSLFEEAGLKNAMVAVHWRTAFIVIYYGFSSPIYPVDEHDFKLTFGNNRELWFIATPYLHAPGAITTFDPKTRTLFSSDIFGAFTQEWKLFADPDYIPHMRTFHEHYMPGSAILNPVLDTFLAMDPAMICPQHGSVIREDVPRYIVALKDLPGVSMFHPVYSSFLEDKERKINQLEEENEKLKKLADRFERNVKEAEERLFRCPVTGLYNERFFKQYIPGAVDIILSQNLGGGLLAIEVDGMARINSLYGPEIGDNTLRKLGLLVQNIAGSNDLCFRLRGAKIALFIPLVEGDDLKKAAEDIRGKVAGSDIFMEPITVSVGLAEIRESSEPGDAANTTLAKELGAGEEDKPISELMLNAALSRSHAAKINGGNRVVTLSSGWNAEDKRKRIAIIEGDAFSAEVLTLLLKGTGAVLSVFSNGEDFMLEVEKTPPDCIISSLSLPRVDGFRIREALRNESETERIPFILISHKKDNDSITRANRLGIVSYFQKPWNPVELKGVVENYLKGVR